MNKIRLLVALVIGLLLLPAALGQQYSDWSEPVNLGCIVNSFRTDGQPFIAKNGLSLFFASGRDGLRFSIFVSQRATADAPWGEPRNVGPAINFPDYAELNPTGPALSPDEHRMFFMSERPGGFGKMDLYVSRRHNRRDDFGWTAAVNLGDGVNTIYNETAPSVFEDDATGDTVLYFQSNRPDGLGGADIWTSTLQPDDTFGPATLVAELSSAFSDNHPAVSRDGLEMYMASNRPGGLGDADIYLSTRASTADYWSTPVLVPIVNTALTENGPAISADGTELYFTSSRPFFCVDPTGVIKPHGQDLWMSTRTKLRD